jgi:pimeloyl-ACP methyl ester carboxylesterase
MPKIRVNDIDLSYEVNGRSDAEPLILLHGFTSTGVESFGKFSSKLGVDYQLFIPDMRGHGKTKNPNAEIRHSDFAQDTAAFVIGLGLEQVHICGHSSGAMQLLFLVHKHPELVHTLTLVSSTYNFDERVKAYVREIRSNAPKEWIDSLTTLHSEIQGSDCGEHILDLWCDAVQRPDELPYSLEDLREISCPTLIMHGDRDPFFPIHIPTTMYQAIPNSELCIFPNCGHNLLADSPVLFETALLEFISRHPIKATHQ